MIETTLATTVLTSSQILRKMMKQTIMIVSLLATCLALTTLAAGSPRTYELW
jgi:hypothetical protein